jgi:hypothetical protein
MLAKGKAPKVLTAAQAGAGCRHSRGERAERLRHEARKGMHRGGVKATMAAPSPLYLLALKGGVSRGF